MTSKPTSAVSLDQQQQQRLSRLNDQVGVFQSTFSDSVIARIGHTPLLALPCPDERVKLWAKLESDNPSRSIKDRTALYLLADAANRGMLTPEITLVEASSGNTGISLAMLCAVLGQNLLIYMADDVSVERRQLIQAYGARIELTPGERGTCGAIEAARAKHAEDGFFWVAQHENDANTLAHYATTGAELLEQNPRVDAFVATSGTTGTLVGVSMRLKEINPKITVVSVWPKDEIMGIRRPEGDAIPLIYDEAWIDVILEVSDEDAKASTRMLAQQAGLLVGPSSGAAYLAACRWVESLNETTVKHVVVLFPDDGMRYLSTDTFQFN